MTPLKNIVDFLILAHIQNNKLDTEKYLHKLGCQIGFKLTYILTVKRETNIIMLLQNLAFEFLPELYQAKRKLTKNENCYVLFENGLTFNEYNSNESFCIDSLVAGIIEAFMLSNGYSCIVTAYDNEGEGTVYTINFVNETISKDI